LGGGEKMTEIQKQKHVEQTRLDRIEHAMTGTLDSSVKLREIVKENHKNQSSLPTDVEVVDKLHNIEVSMYSQHAQIARWFIELIKEIRPRTEMDKLFNEMDKKGLPA
jgi:hypothetical protein